MAPSTRSDPAERLLDAADRMLARFGYRKMTVEDLAAEAGIGKGSVYLSFPSKESVALGCIDRMAGRLLERLRAIAASDEPPAVRVRTILIERVLHRFDYARQHSQSLDDMLATIRPALLERRAGHFRAEAEVLAAVILEGHRQGWFAVRDPAETAETLVVATNSLLPYSLSPRELGRRREIARRAEAVADLVVTGLVHRGAPAVRRHGRSTLRSTHS